MDSELIAQAIAAARDFDAYERDDREGAYQLNISRLARRLATEMSKANPAFDRAAFLKACGCC